MPHIAPAPTQSTQPTQLSDRDLIETVARLVACERSATADLIAALAELDARRLYLGDGCASLFVYCTRRLHLSESAAYHRITAARTVGRFPLILDRLRDGALTLTAVGLLAPHLTDANHHAVLDEARHQGKRAVEEIVARLHARPDVAASVRKLPTRRVSAPDHAAVAQHVPDLPNGAAGASEGLFASPSLQASAPDHAAVAQHVPDLPNGAAGASDGPVASPSLLAGAAGASDGPVASPSLLNGADAGILEERALPSPLRRAVVRAIAPARYQIQVTVSADTHAKFRRAQDLLRHVIPDGDPAAVLDRALTVLLARLERTTYAATITARAPAAPPSTARRAATSRGTPACRAGHASRSSPDHARGRPSGGAPHARPRTIPAGVRRSVWARDEGQCTFGGASGRCTERGFLEFHHRVPFAAGGSSTVENVALLCHAHNALVARQDFPVALEAVAPIDTMQEGARDTRATSSGAS